MRRDENETESMGADAADRALDALLAAASQSLESARPELSARIQAQIARTERFQRRAAGFVFAAAASLAAIAWFALSDRRAEQRAAFPAPTEIAARNAAQPPSTPVQVEVGDQAIALPMESKEPTVTIVWVYPAVASKSESGPATEVPNEKEVH